MTTASLPTGRTLHYDEYGDAATPAVLALHGIGTDRRMWRPLALELRARYHIITPDLLGHGEAEWDDLEPPELASECSALLGLLDSLGIELAAVVGWDVGGTLALQVALAAPSRTAALVIADTSPGPPGVVRQAANVSAGVARFGGREIARRTAQGTDDTFRRGAVFASTYYAASDAIGPALAAWRNGPDLRASLGALGVPAAVVASEGGPLAGSTAEIAAMLSGARVVTVAGANGDAPLARPDAFAQVVRTFLVDVEEGRQVVGTSRV